MADVLGNFGPKKRGGSGSGSSHTQRRRRSRRREAKWQYGTDRVQVEIQCCQHSVEAKWQFGAEKLKAALLAATVPGYSRGLAWNVVQKKYMNQDRESVPPDITLTCPSLDFLRALCQACHESQWCSHWYITGRDGRTIPCSSTTIGSLDVDFDDPPPRAHQSKATRTRYAKMFRAS